MSATCRRHDTECRRLGKKTTRRHPTCGAKPKISTVLQELEGFTYATALDLNMGYFTIRLDPDASRICTIIFPWGKYSYKRLPMGVAGSPDIFQAKMSELMIDLEFFRTYRMFALLRNFFSQFLADFDVS